ncbi:sulfatase-like hydrolase/transferase [Marinilabilia rubra]|uniref:N-acetylgalactosamine 6-sulfate sulfatase n=1 Tax=Marinilabilia rubra TaxID=2162893 RepID=A0A2U2B7D6_9BACT|nr:sulfatase-like hydrolase/transferase [Marinilabilia rubra]PWD98962.1 hypothetical protein DDZ16_13275 [Marinilabilia rubra]
MKGVMKSIILCAMFFSSVSCWGASEETKKQPNILLILVDDLGYGDLSINGGTDIKTPHIDKLFGQGMKFTNFYSNSTVCSPTRASLITGCYPDIAGVPGVVRSDETNSWGYLREDLATLPTMLKKAGYRTAIIGKWHLGLESPNTPNERGFDLFHGFLGDMMDDYWTHLRHGKNYMRLNDKVIKPEGHATDIFSYWAVDYFQEAKDKDNPFFLYLAYNAPHFPIQPPEAWLEKVQQREPELSGLRAKNVAFVEHLDDAIGRVLNGLESNGLLDNTLVIFSSDNGGSLPHGASNGSLRGGKQDMYEGGIKVPTCFVWENQIQRGTQTENMGLTMDIYPTLLDITGVDIENEVDGLSLYPTLIGKPQNTSDRIVYFMRREGVVYGGLCYYATRQGDFKLLQNTPFEPLQLFNLARDPKEQNPLDPSLRKFEQLKYIQSQHIRRAGAILWQKPSIKYEQSIVSVDTVLTDEGNEDLYGYRAMKYSNGNYNYDLPYRLYVPEKYEEGEKLPLVIFLHGAGRRGSDNVSQIKDMTGPMAFVDPGVQQKNPSFVLAPQCPRNEKWRGSTYSGKRRPGTLEDVKPSSAYLMLMELVQNIQDQYGIDSDRIFLTGQSMGGAGTWFVALSNPEKFAAIAPICGWSFPAEVSAIADVPVWAFHGEDDKTVLPRGSREMVKALKEVGNTKVKYTEYPNVGHESWKKAYTEDSDNNGEADLIEWMFSQKRK